MIHQIFSLSTLYGYLFARKHSIPYVVFPHGSLTEYHSRDSRLKKYVAKRIIINRILRESDLVIATCESEFQDLPDFLKDKARIIPYAINSKLRPRIPRTQTKKTEDSRIIIFSGRFHRKKNVPLILRALPFVLEKIPNVKLKLAGDGSLAEIRVLHEIISENELGNNVEILGWLGGDELEEFYNSAELLVLPSFNENFALVVAEALQAGVPCVVSKEVGTADIISRTGAGIVLSEKTPEVLAGALIQVLNNGRDFYHEATCHAVNEELDSRPVANKWIEAFRELNL